MSSQPPRTQARSASALTSAALALGGLAIASIALPAAIVLSPCAVWWAASARGQRLPWKVAALASLPPLLLGWPQPTGPGLVPVPIALLTIIGSWLSAGLVAHRRASGAPAASVDRARAEPTNLLVPPDAVLQTVLDAIPVRVFWKDRQNVYVGCNQSFADDAGLASPADIVGETDFDLAFSDQAELYRADDQLVMSSGQPKLNYEEPQVRGDGGELAWLRTSKIPLFDASGAVIGVLGTYEDITERRNLEDQLRQAQKLEAVGQLAGGIAHDFNNVLTIILGNADALRRSLLSDGKLDDEQAEELSDISQAAERAAAVTRGLLAFSRREVISPRVVSMDAVVQDLEPMLRSTTGEGVELVLDFSSEAPRVLIDVRQLEQAVLNLVINARDAMPQGGRLTISTAHTTIAERDSVDEGGLAPGLYAELCVRDTGVGMDEATLARIFEPFFTTKGVGEGTGLGLATVHGIVTAAGGQIHVDTQGGQGTCFTLRLPAALGETADAAEEVPRVAIGGRETVLVVEDDVSIRRLVSHLLESRGYRVLEAQSPRHAVVLAERYGEPIQLIVTDVIMPELNGREVGDQVRAHHPESRVLYMSGYTSNVIAQHGAPLEGASFLEKPFTADQLLSRVRQLLDDPPL